MATTRKTPAKRPVGRPRKKPVAAPAAPADDYFDDLIGGGPATTPEEQEELNSGLDLGLVFGGVSASWLGHVFGMDKNTVKKKLAQGNCTVVGMNKGAPLYTIKDAASYLIPPKVDLVSYLKGLRPNDLPPILNDAYWSAQIKRQKWEENAGDLWRTADVLEVLGDLAKLIKTTVQLWTDELDRLQGISDEQRVALTQMTDGLLDEVHNVLISAPSRRQTLSTSAEQEDSKPDGI